MTSLCHVSGEKLPLFYKSLQASVPLQQDILISYIVIGLLFHKGRGLVSDMLSELISVPLGLFDVI